MLHETVTFHFDGIQAAAAGLLSVVMDARLTEDFYTFGPLTADLVLSRGLEIAGEIQAVAKKVEAIPGAVRYDG